MLDVDKMLEAMTPRQFDEWLAYQSVEPLSDGWQQTGIMAATIHNELELIRCGLAGKSSPRLHGPEDYVPNKAPRSRKKDRMTPEQMEAQSRSAAGLN